MAPELRKSIASCSLSTKLFSNLMQLSNRQNSVIILYLLIQKTLSWILLLHHDHHALLFHGGTLKISNRTWFCLDKISNIRIIHFVIIFLPKRDLNVEKKQKDILHLKCALPPSVLSHTQGDDILIKLRGAWPRSARFSEKKRGAQPRSARFFDRAWPRSAHFF